MAGGTVWIAGMHPWKNTMNKEGLATIGEATQVKTGINTLKIEMRIH